jgi:hypothetical protein
MTSKRLVVFAIGVVFLVPAAAVGIRMAVFFVPWLAGEPSHNFTDVLGIKLSPGGKIRAASVVESRGFAAPTTYGITLSSISENPLDARPVITAGEYRNEIDYKWMDAKTLAIRLPCGWWGNLTNHYQLPNTDEIIDIVFLPPSGCEAISRSSALPSKATLQGGAGNNAKGDK